MCSTQVASFPQPLWASRHSTERVSLNFGLRGLLGLACSQMPDAPQNDFKGVSGNSQWRFRRILLIRCWRDGARVRMSSSGARREAKRRDLSSIVRSAGLCWVCWLLFHQKYCREPGDLPAAWLRLSIIRGNASTVRRCWCLWKYTSPRL